MTAATEAECLYVVEEVMAAFPFPGDTVHFINHSKILDAVVERVPIKRRSDVLEVLVQHGRLQRTWSKTAGELLKLQGVTKAMVDEMGSLDCYGKSFLFYINDNRSFDFFPQVTFQILDQE